jgi:hypothetical protein
MRLWGALLIAVALVPSTAFAAADDGTVSFSDACGDNNPYFHSAQASTGFPGTERTPRYDIAGATFSPVAGGVSISLAMCSAVDASDGLQGFRGVSATLADGCGLTISVEEPAKPGDARTARTAKICDQPNAAGQCPLDTCEDVRFDVALPADALTVAGKTLTVTVRRALLTGEAATTFAPDSVWGGLRAGAYEAPTAFAVIAGDTRAGGPTGADYAGSSEPFVVR